MGLCCSGLWWGIDEIFIFLFDFGGGCFVLFFLVFSFELWGILIVLVDLMIVVLCYLEYFLIVV